MSLRLALLPIVAVFAAGSALAQNTPPVTPTPEDNNNTQEKDSPRRFWQAKLPGGHYMVALDRITSVSKHEYLLDGSLVVTEVSIDTVGNSLVRFYQITPLDTSSTTANTLIKRGQELLDQAGQKTGTNAHEMVVKQYPTTTHSKIVEYRLLDIKDLEALYKSIQDAWESGRGRRFEVK